MIELLFGFFLGFLVKMIISKIPKYKISKAVEDQELKAEKPIENLYRKIDITSETRFHASRRLKLHSTLSMITNILLPMFLIMLSVLQVLQVGENIDSTFAVFLQIYASIIILIFSIITAMKNYTGTSEKFYACASELVEMKRRLQPFKHECTEESYEKLQKQYNNILQKYETHTVNDFRSDYVRAKLYQENPKKELTIVDKFKMQLSWRSAYVLSFSYYFLIFISLIPLLVYILMVDATYLSTQLELHLPRFMVPN
ncbi:MULTISPECIES: SLATT domain-containing protein [unclassified Halomonas]|uniref:SLATT domain-containing protein n=1 Tax=unclassified Halomonas TaxID=2609666 RepID=UPI0007D937AC|nr:MULTISPECIES: SLATT domain-containing protein [unclassified Halomonas]MBT2787863.1 SLATT domain-containing protein [Halomonas sp. ISL-106]MBT2795612.1 SLATT domain-containing protein [Halomonas sp. ISL-104]OAL60921.1 hypothetical protein A6R74_14980 [Halomonas sp. ALS9]